MANEKKEPKNIQSVHRALDILEYLIESGDGRKLSEIAESCGLNTTTAFHIIKTLESRNYIEQSPDSLKYKTGGKMFSLSLKTYRNVNLTRLFQPYIEQLSHSFGETVSLFHYCKIASGMKGLCVYALESENPVHVSVSIGKLVPLSNTAVGKLYLSALSEENLTETLASELEDPSLPELRRQISDVGLKQYCVEFGEYEKDIINVAVPIYKYSGRVVASICISIPIHRAKEDRISEMVKAMLPISKELSALPL